jgi:hypothetical protein
VGAEIDGDLGGAPGGFLKHVQQGNFLKTSDACGRKLKLYLDSFAVMGIRAASDIGSLTEARNTFFIVETRRPSAPDDQAILPSLIHLHGHLRFTRWLPLLFGNFRHGGRGEQQHARDGYRIL